MGSDFTQTSRSESNTQSLTVWDTVSLLIGIVVGTGIFRSPPMVFGNVANVETGLAVWGIGAFLALNGALCYCELATTYPHFGAEYVYLSRAYGRRLGFLFAWMQLCVILTGSIGAMVFVFADYAVALSPRLNTLQPWIASAGLIALTGIHLCGIQVGKGMQNILSVAKTVALVAILFIGVFAAAPSHPAAKIQAEQGGNIGLALVFVLYAYGGWNDVAQVTPEVRSFQRNMPRALLIGLSVIAVLYLSLNFAFYQVLGFDGVRKSETPATDVVALTMGSSASVAMSLVVMCSALGAVHGMLFASPRLLAAIGEDYRMFSGWNVWNAKRVPTAAILTVTGITLLLILGVGTEGGRNTTSDFATGIGLPRPRWDDYFGGFNTLVSATAPIFWFFFALSALAVIVLRIKEPDAMRPFRVPFYPWPPVIFCFSALFMLWKSLEYAWQMTLLSLPVFLVGVVLSFSKTRSERAGSIPARK